MREGLCVSWRRLNTKSSDSCQKLQEYQMRVGKSTIYSIGEEERDVRTAYWITRITCVNERWGGKFDQEYYIEIPPVKSIATARPDIGRRR